MRSFERQPNLLEGRDRDRETETERQRQTDRQTERMRSFERHSSLLQRQCTYYWKDSAVHLNDGVVKKGKNARNNVKLFMDSAVEKRLQFIQLHCKRSKPNQTRD